MKHSIVLFLSPFTIATRNDDNLRHTKYRNIEEETVEPENPEVDCVQTNESVVRFFQAKLAKQDRCNDKIYIMDSKVIISRIKNLIRAVETKHWDKVTVIDELKEIIDVSKETVGKNK